MLRIISISRVILEESESGCHLVLCFAGFAGWHEWYGRLEGLVLALLLLHFALRPHRTWKEFKTKMASAMEAELAEQEK